MLGCYIQQTAKYFREGLVLIPLIQKASLRCHRSLEPRVLRWLEDKQVQNLGLLIPGHHTFHLQRAKPSPSRNAQMQKFHQALTIGLPEISFLHISQTWDYQVFFFSLDIYTSVCFQNCDVPRTIYEWLGTRSLGCQGSQVLPCTFIGLSSGYKEREEDS